MDQRFVLTAERGKIFSLSHGICLSAKVYGDIGCENFKRALNKMLKKYPVLGSSICLEPDGERSLSYKQNKELEPVYYPYGEVNYIEKHIEKEERIPYELEQGPLVKVILFKGEERSIVVLMASPVIADVISLRRALETIVYYLNHEEETVGETLLIKEPGIESVKEERLLSLKDWFDVKRLNHQWKKRRRTFNIEEYRLRYGAYHKEHVTPILLKEIRSRSTESLLANCKNKEVSVDAALLTAFIAVVNSFDRGHFGREIPIHYTVDLRNYISSMDESEVGSFDGILEFKKPYVLQVSFWDNVKAIDEYLKTKLANRRQALRELQLRLKLEGSLLESLPFLDGSDFNSESSRKALDLLKQGEKERGIALCPMREITYSKEENFYIDALNVIPPASVCDDLTVGSCIVNGRLRLCIRYDKGHYSEHIVEEMVRTAVNYMWNRTET